MVNCVATVYKDVDVLDHGHKAATQNNASVLYTGPAYLAAPSRSWQQEAALEGVISGDLHVHTTAGLQGATRVVVTQHPTAGAYQVLASAVTASEWRMALGRRP